MTILIHSTVPCGKKKKKKETTWEGEREKNKFQVVWSFYGIIKINISKVLINEL